MAHKTLESDVVVVGSGAGGAGVAGELLRHGLEVVIVEAGPLAREPVGSHARNVIPFEDDLPAVGRMLEEALVYPGRAEVPPGDLTELMVIYGVGGMFAYWTCNCPAPHPSELSGCLPPERWQGLLERARALLSVNTDLGRGSLRQERIINRVEAVVGPLSEGRGVQPMPVAVDLSGPSPRFRSADDLLARPSSPDPLILLTDLIARKVIHQGSRALGIVAHPCIGGASVTIRAETVIVACGTAQSPQLLAASGIDGGPALGRYMFDHPAIGSRVVLQREIVEGIAVDDPLFTVWIPFAPERPWHNQVVRFPSNPGPIEFDAGLREIADIFTFASMDVVPENRLEFDHDQLDPLGLPAIRAQYRLSQVDNARIAAGLAEHFRIAAAIGDTVNHRWVATFYRPGWSSHMMGGCGMGAKDDGESVVDPTGRLWGYDNLYIAGNSVHRTSNAGNPTLITISFALNTADAIIAARGQAPAPV